MPPSASDYLPLKPVDLEILIALAGEDMHGYGLVRAVASHTGGLIDLDPGNLYRVIKRLLETRVIAEAGQRVVEDAGGERRKYYSLTKLGGRVLGAELERLRRLVNATAIREIQRRFTP